ncbi:MAG: LysR family transcriptional regulator [Nitratireductor sp.]|nr:LysR family transcriptional regulator [Nitratireductor sp.]
MPIPFSFRQLEYFVAVAEHGSVTQAAQRCNVSQPSVSVAIADLEAIIGRKLFHRGAGQKLSITPAGRQLLVDARTTLAAAGGIGGGDAASGEIGVACFRDLGALYLPRLMTGFARANAEVDFRIQEGDLAEVHNLIVNGQCELALTYHTGPATAGLKTIGIDRLSAHVLLPKSHPLADSKTIGLEQLVNDRMILENYPSTIAFFLPLLNRHGLGEENCQRVSSFEMQRGLIANGWGVGLSYARPMPDSAYDGTPLSCLPLAGDAPVLEVVVAHLGERTLSRAARAFLTYVRSVARPLSPTS